MGAKLQVQGEDEMRNQEQEQDQDQGLMDPMDWPTCDECGNQHHPQPYCPAEVCDTCMAEDNPDPQRPTNWSNPNGTDECAFHELRTEQGEPEWITLDEYMGRNYWDSPFGEGCHFQGQGAAEYRIDAITHNEYGEPTYTVRMYRTRAGKGGRRTFRWSEDEIHNQVSMVANPKWGGALGADLGGMDS